MQKQHDVDNDIVPLVMIISKQCIYVAYTYAYVLVRVGLKILQQTNTARSHFVALHKSLQLTTLIFIFIKHNDYCHAEIHVVKRMNFSFQV